jgi:hypothetical protein
LDRVPANKGIDLSFISFYLLFIASELRLLLLLLLLLLLPLSLLLSLLLLLLLFFQSPFKHCEAFGNAQNVPTNLIKR